MLQIDGSAGEGGGQILRSALGLSLVTGIPFRMTNIRAGRKRPGLLHQHLTAVRAAARIGAAYVEGHELSSRHLIFHPSSVQPGKYEFSLGTAGSTTLVLQAVLPALLTANGPSELLLRGGTHNPFAPPFDFLARAYLPLIEAMGPRISAVLRRPGFYPAGGGELIIQVNPCAELRPLNLLERGPLQAKKAVAKVAHLPASIGHRELKVVADKLSFRHREMRVEEIPESLGPGNALILEFQSAHVTEVFTGFGQIHKPAEKVASEAVRQAKAYLKTKVPVGPHLADQLLLPIAMAAQGSFRTLQPSLHARTNAEIVAKFLPVQISMTDDHSGTLVQVKTT